MRISQSPGRRGRRLSTVIHTRGGKRANLCLAVPGADLAEPCVFSGHHLCQQVTGSGTGGDNSWPIVDNFGGLGIRGGNVGIRRGEPAYVLCMSRDLCVDWHRCANPGRGRGGDMWIAYPQVLPAGTCAATRKTPLIPSVHTTTVKTGFLHILLIDTCGTYTLWGRRTSPIPGSRSVCRAARRGRAAAA